MRENEENLRAKRLRRQQEIEEDERLAREVRTSPMWLPTRHALCSFLLLCLFLLHLLTFGHPM